MTAEVINLRRARKAKARAEASRAADVASAKAGERNADKLARRQEEARTARELDGAKRERD